MLTEWRVLLQTECEGNLAWHDWKQGQWKDMIRCKFDQDGVAMSVPVEYVLSTWIWIYEFQFEYESHKHTEMRVTARERDCGKK